jgi:hypothetical protein
MRERWMAGPTSTRGQPSAAEATGWCVPELTRWLHHRLDDARAVPVRADPAGTIVGAPAAPRSQGTVGYGDVTAR